MSGDANRSVIDSLCAALFASSWTKPPGADVLSHVLIALLVIVGLARIIGRLGRRFGQPPVIGEIIAGLLIGPSVLGRFAPELTAHLFPKAIVPLIQVLAQVGVIVFMFLVGVELDPSRLRKRAPAALVISHVSMVVPFGLGALLALYLYPRYAPHGVTFTSFTLFVGISMSVTAFPVLARILAERKLQETPVGVLSLTCAAIDDVTAWCALAIVVGIVKSELTPAITTIVAALVYVAAMWFVVRPLVLRAAQRVERLGKLSQGGMAWALLVALVSAYATEAIGIHPLFGAFVFGGCIPHDSVLAKQLRERMEDLVVVLLLPTFFAITGMRTQIGLISGGSGWVACGLIFLVACCGKLGGSTVAARFAGLSWRDSATIGALMNTRGLMELVVLNLGLDLGVISPELFAMLVLMAVTTTFMTSPLLSLLRRAETP